VLVSDKNSLLISTTYKAPAKELRANEFADKALAAYNGNLRTLGQFGAVSNSSYDEGKVSLRFHQEGKHARENQNRAKAEEAGTDEGDYPVNRRIDSPSEPEEADDTKPRPEYGRRQSVFWLGLAFTRPLLSPVEKVKIEVVPEWI